MTLLLARIWTLRVPFGIGVCTLLLLSCDIRRPNEFLPLEDGETCVSDVECSGGFACSAAFAQRSVARERWAMDSHAPRTPTAGRI